MCIRDRYKDLRHSFGSWAKDSEGHEDYDGQFKDWDNETPIQDDAPFKEFGDEDDEVIDDEEASNKRMDIIGQNGNEGTHYTYDWDDNIKGYDYESNTILNSINDSITLIKDRMEDIDMRMDNIDEQLGILNADVANIEYSIENPIKQSLIDGLNKYNAFNDVVDMESGEVSYDEDGGFNSPLYKKVKKVPNQSVTQKVMGKWQIDNKTKEVVKLDKTKVRKGKIKDLKK